MKVVRLMHASLFLLSSKYFFWGWSVVHALIFLSWGKSNSLWFKLRYLCIFVIWTLYTINCAEFMEKYQIVLISKFHTTTWHMFSKKSLFWLKSISRVLYGKTKHTLICKFMQTSFSFHLRVLICFGFINLWFCVSKQLIEGEIQKFSFL